MTEDRLLAITVGKRNSLNKAINLEPYNPEWPSIYTKLEDRICGALGTKAQMIEHVGSTSAPGVSALRVRQLYMSYAG